MLILMCLSVLSCLQHSGKMSKLRLLCGKHLPWMTYIYVFGSQRVNYAHRNEIFAPFLELRNKTRLIQAYFSRILITNFKQKIPWHSFYLFFRNRFILFQHEIEVVTIAVFQYCDKTKNKNNH